MQIESVWWDEQHQCQVIVTPMPGRVLGTVTATDDDSFVVLINANKTDEIRRKAYRHELWHIVNGDLYCADDISTIECRAHGKAG